MADVSFVVAFAAGLVSFLSPCILPLIPGFLAYLAGSTVEESSINRRKVFLNSVMFVLGFSVVFALLGVILNTVLQAVAYDAQAWLARIGGAVMIFFGLYMTGILKLGFLGKGFSLKVGGRKPGYASSFTFGAAFATAWTPCVGAALGIILGLATIQPGAAFVLLLAYSLGLGVPFLVTGLFTSRVADVIQRNMGTFIYIRKIFGVVLVVLGILAFTQTLTLIANFELLGGLVA